MNRYDGLGYMLNEREVGIDLDNVFHGGVMEPFVVEILKHLGNPYVEASPSGHGIHAIVELATGKLPEPRCRFTRSKPEKYGAEIYAPHRIGDELIGGRYLTVTGKKVSGNGVPVLEDITLPHFLMSQILNEKFKRLWCGDASDYDKDRSRATPALLVMLSHGPWGRDRARIERMFRLSLLMRDKCDEKRGDSTWLAKELDFALRGNNEDTASGSLTKVSGGVSAELVPFPLKDYGNGQRLITRCGLNLRYCHATRKWLVWDRRRWQVDDQEVTRTLAHQTVIEFGHQAMVVGNQAAAKYAAQSLDTHRITNMQREAQPKLTVSPEDLDANPLLLNFLNGTYDIRTGQLREASRTDLITKLVHHNYEPDATAPAFLNFVLETFGELVAYVQKAIGYSLTGVTSEKVSFWCWGPTNTGKTTFLDLVRYLFREYAVLIQVDSLMAQNRTDNNSQADLADLRGARLAVTSETEEGQRLLVGRLKRLTQGQGKIKVARKYENPIEFHETHKLWVDTNHLPEVRDRDDAAWNRLIPISCQNVVTTIDQQLPEKLRYEAMGVIAWVVAGARLWFSEGLGVPPQLVAEARGAWRSEMDQMSAWFGACCDKGKERMAGFASLYNSYRDWCFRMGEHAISANLFGRRLTAMGFEKNNRSVYTGIGLREMPQSM